MTNIIQRLKSSIAYRTKWARLGVYYVRKPHTESIFIGGRDIKLSFPDAEKTVQAFELHRILLEDCYRLATVPGLVRNVLDIGANIGLFALAARKQYPGATIHCYEPNRLLEPHLKQHCHNVSAGYFMQAVGSKSCVVNIQSAGGSMHSVARLDESGAIPQIAFSEAVGKLGSVDVLKLDCEGAEWDIFSNPEPWARVRTLCMEYHVWAKPNSTTDMVEAALRGLHFTKVMLEPDPSGAWGFAFARK